VNLLAIVFFRTLIIFITLIFFMRLLGKRQLGELELSELVVSVLIADLAAHPLQDIGIPLLNGILPIVILFCCELIISGMIVKNIRIRSILCGRPSVLIDNGKIVQKEMQKNRFTLDELTEELRNQSIMDISKIKYAILETDGTLNTILFPAERPVTAGQMQIVVEDPGFSAIIINDGRVMSENLKHMGRDEAWLRRELEKRKVKGPQDVYLMTINHAGQVYYAPKEVRA
jgi:uncharacterized membrane protein YcaP (DUF421 family)